VRLNKGTRKEEAGREVVGGKEEIELNGKQVVAGNRTGAPEGRKQPEVLNHSCPRMRGLK